MSINFRELENKAGPEGARGEFERLIVQLAYLKHAAMAVLARPGDWGIDAFVGDLEGDVAIWQAKYFPAEIEADQQGQVRESFKSARKAAAERSHEVKAWTLCVPTDLDGPAHKWWSKWKKRTERDTGVLIDLWPRTALEAMLLSQEALHLAAHFFPSSSGTAATIPPAKVLPLPSDQAYIDSLFIQQLEEAGFAENAVAKREFFNHEALAREVGDKADPTEVQTLESIQAEIHSIWETRFNAATPHPRTGRDPNLHSGVMEAIRDQYKGNQPTMPRMNLVHQKGTMHYIVDNGDAGWVAHFRRIAQEHRGQS